MASLAARSQCRLGRRHSGTHARARPSSGPSVMSFQAQRQLCPRFLGQIARLPGRGGGGGGGGAGGSVCPDSDSRGGPSAGSTTRMSMLRSERQDWRCSQRRRNQPQPRTGVSEPRASPTAAPGTAPASGPHPGRLGTVTSARGGVRGVQPVPGPDGQLEPHQRPPRSRRRPQWPLQRQRR